jgi:hypothetical protein
MHTDVVLADMALRTQVIGRIEVTRYLERVLGQVPYGHASTLRHVVGGRGGGGFEWTAGPGAEHLAGITITRAWKPRLQRVSLDPVTGEATA